MIVARYCKKLALSAFLAVPLVLQSIPVRALCASQWYAGAWKCSIDGRPATMHWWQWGRTVSHCDGGVCSQHETCEVGGRFAEAPGPWFRLVSNRSTRDEVFFTYKGDNTPWYLKGDSRAMSGWTTWAGNHYPLSCVKSGGSDYRLGLEPLRMWWSEQRGDNFTTATKKGDQDAMAARYRYVRVEGCVMRSPIAQSVPLKLWWSQTRGDNFITATGDGDGDAQASRYALIRTEGYVFPSGQPETIPLKLFYSDQRGDNFTLATAEGEHDALASGYRFVRVEGYVYPASFCH